MLTAGCDVRTAGIVIDGQWSNVIVLCIFSIYQSCVCCQAQHDYRLPRAAGSHGFLFRPGQSEASPPRSRSKSCSLEFFAPTPTSMSRNISKTLLSPRQFQCLTRCRQSHSARLSGDDTQPLLPRVAGRYNAPRSFSTSQPWRASSVMRSTKATGRKLSQPSQVVSQKHARDQALRDGETGLDDIGVLPDTFIMPFQENRPSWFTKFKDRLKLEKRRWRTRGAEVMGYVIMRMLKMCSGY